VGSEGQIIVENGVRSKKVIRHFAQTCNTRRNFFYIAPNGKLRVL
jgi:hypothetical protein